MSEPHKVKLLCEFCSEEHEAETTMPEGWGDAAGAYVLRAFCPKHIVAKQFLESQCPGCVSMWGDCNLYSQITNLAHPRLTAGDIALIKAGVCPRRVGGTMGFDSSLKTLRKVNISERATPEAGEAMANAIADFEEECLLH